jgi:hypothetical protein
MLSGPFLLQRGRGHELDELTRPLMQSLQVEAGKRLVSAAACTVLGGAFRSARRLPSASRSKAVSEPESRHLSLQTPCR